MREILFRAKRSGRDEWVRGYLTKMWGMLHIVDEHDENKAFVIDDDTIGQFTGLTDKNGTKIFEGDIVNVTTSKDALRRTYRGKHLIVRFDEYHRFVASGGLEYPLCNHYEWEVIGNIHDNPEFLTGGTEWKDD